MFDKVKEIADSWIIANNPTESQLKLAEGQLRAGNNNPLVKEELKDILKKLTLYNCVSLQNSKDYLKQF